MVARGYPDSGVFERGSHRDAVRRIDAQLQDASETLMMRYVAGDPRAFEELYVRTNRQVFQYFTAVGLDRSAAEQLCAATYMKLHRARVGYIEGTPVTHWLMAIARTALREHEAAVSTRLAG